VDLTHLAIAPWDVVVRCIAVYLVMTVALRVFGKRELGQMTIFDLVLVLLVANAVQPAMTGPDTSLLGGLLIIGTLFVANLGIAQARSKSSFVRHLLVSPPTVLARDGKWIPGAITSQGVDADEAEMALREHGVAGVKDSELVELESDGSISVVPKQEAGRQRPRRRVRMIKRP
jgi:uncharacterized membrane protein YcaP (DUF421 family)